MASRKRGKTTDSFFVDLPGLWQLHPLRRTSFGEEFGKRRSREPARGLSERRMRSILRGDATNDDGGPATSRMSTVALRFLTGYPGTPPQRGDC